ncbi:uncharacterized protein LOC115065093 [Mus pahari]|uniref:uncharacterized protein LOC115065093 n=1 Tax=Mus pahari TaxID=10093 RepID=UPI001114C4AB|nr:uncharacterized protein LOC115065093 [Mus pahari]
MSLEQHPASSSRLGGLGAPRRRGGGRDRRVAPPPDGPSALGAGMRQSRDLTSGAGVLSSRGAPRVPAGPPRSVTGRRGRGEGVRFVADGGRPLRSTDRPPPAGLPRRAPLFSPCPAARRLRRSAAAGADSGARTPLSPVRPGPGPRRGASVPTAGAATRGGGPSSPSDPRPPAPAVGDGVGLRRGGGGGESGPPAPCGLLAARAGRPRRRRHGGAAGLTEAS